MPPGSQNVINGERGAVSVVQSGEAGLHQMRANARKAFARLSALFGDGSDQSIARRMAGTAFLIRVISAAVIFISQVLLARWMGRFEFGVYVYVWTWVLLLGGLVPLGIPSAAQRFIPEYLGRGELDRLRGFLLGSRWLAFGLGSAAALIGVLLVFTFGRHLESYYLVPLVLACICLPIYAVGDTQDGIARSFNWIDLALGPAYLARPVLILLFMVAAHALGAPLTATAAMIAATVATWLLTFLQLVLLERRLKPEIAPGPRVYESRVWFRTALPIFMVGGFYFLLTYTDILVLEAFYGPNEVAVYYAATKTLSLVAFVYFSVSAATAHRFSEYHVAGAREKLEAFLGNAIQWTFWPSLVATLGLLVVGKPVLSLFGAGFDQGYPLMFVLAVGLLARAAIGPVERLLNMVGEQRACAAVYAAAFATNLGLCLLLVKPLGTLGAAIATSSAMVVESSLLFIVTKRRLGLHVFIWRPRRA
jgi:O-antigen/teichoic acid export membrane protein